MTTKQRGATRRKGSLAFRVLRSVLGYAVGGACLYWLFHNLPLAQLAQAIAGIQWWWLPPCVVLVLAAYVCVAWQWRLLLRPAGTLPFGRAVQAVFAGRFANDVLPMQVGYLVRAILVSRWMGISLAATLPSLIIERLWDGLWLALGIGLVSFFVALPPGVAHARDIFAGIVVAGTAAVAAVVVLRCRSRSKSQAADAHRSGVLGRIRAFLKTMADGMGDIARSHLLPAVVGLALLKLVIQALAFLMLVWGFNFGLPVGAAVAVFLAGYLGICIPSTPASTGLFQLFVVAVLGYFGVAKPAAAGFSLVSFAALTLPPALTGFFALSRSRLTLRQIRSSSL